MECKFSLCVLGGPRYVFMHMMSSSCGSVCLCEIIKTNAIAIYFLRFDPIEIQVFNQLLGPSRFIASNNCRVAHPFQIFQSLHSFQDNWGASSRVTALSIKRAVQQRHCTHRLYILFGKPHVAKGNSFARPFDTAITPNRL